MKKKQDGAQPAGRRLRKAVDGPEIMRLYATMPTAELAQQRGLTVKQIENFVYRENMEEWARKSAAVISAENSAKGKKGGGRAGDGRKKSENKKLTLFFYGGIFVNLPTGTSSARNLKVYFYGARSILLPNWKYTVTKVGVLTQDFKLTGQGF